MIYIDDTNWYNIGSDEDWSLKVLKNLKFADVRSQELKGVLHPSAVFGLFLHFSQKLQHIGDK